MQYSLINLKKSFLGEKRGGQPEPRHTSALFVFFIGGTSSVIWRSHKQIRPIDLNFRWNTARHPVLNTLNATARFVILKQLSHLCRPAKFLNDLSVSLNLLCIVHRHH